MIILNDNNEVDYYFNLFNNYFKNNIFKFPSWDNIPYEEVSPSQIIINERFKTINCFKNKIIEKTFYFIY